MALIGLWQYAHWLEVDLPRSTYALVFSATLALYNFDRLIEQNSGEQTTDSRKFWLNKHKSMLWTVTMLAMIIAVLNLMGG